ncbi:MAG: glycosyltransferase [Desulfomonilaceae bacterium]
MRVLWISPKLPFPPESGDKLRQFNLIKRLSQRTEISLAAFVIKREEEEYASYMRQYCRRVRTFYSPNRSYARRLLAMASHAVPYYVWRYHSRTAIEYVRNQLAQFRPHVLQIEHTYMGEYVRAIPHDMRPPSVLTKHNLDADLAYQSYRLAKGSVAKTFWWLEWKKMSRYEPAVDKSMSALVVMSQEDKNRLLAKEQTLPPIEIVENGVDTALLRPLSPVHDPVAIFVGAFDYLPNQDAAFWFCKEILPRIKEFHVNAKVLLVGRNPSGSVTQLMSDGVEVHADAPDVLPYYRRAAVAVAPLRGGSGSRLKILEAMALGRPVVSTQKGAEGLELEPGKDFLQADDPTAFAAAVASLIRDRKLYRSIAEHARKTVEAKYDWDIAAQKMTLLYERLAREGLDR